MKRISLLALALSTTATMAGSEDYFEGGILWTTFAPQIANEIAVTERDIYRTDASTLNDNENGYTGNDRDRVNSVPPLIAWEGGTGWNPTHNGKTLATISDGGIHLSIPPTWKEEVDRRFQPTGYTAYHYYGAWMGGSHKYKRELNASLTYAPAEDNFIRFQEPIEIYSDLGKINKLPLPYGDVPNKIIAKGVLIVENNKKIHAEFKGGGTDFCEVTLVVNGNPVSIDKPRDLHAAVFDVKKGKNTFTLGKTCDFYSHISSYKGGSLRAPTSYGEKIWAADTSLKKIPTDTRLNPGEFAFRFIDLATDKTITTIKNRIRVQEQLPLDINYSEAEKADPVLWSWIGNHYSYFTGPDQVQLDENEQSIVQPVPLKANLANMELIDEAGQKTRFSQALNARKNMYKGTFFPKTTGIYEVLVVKKTNISVSHGHNMSPKKGISEFAYPIYSLAFDYSRPVAHSITRKGHAGQKPIEYDWFWFEVNDDDVKYGMDMSLMVHGNTGLLSLLHRTYGHDERYYNKNGKQDYEFHWLLDSATNASIETNQALNLGIKASQKIGFYIKPARATKFRSLQQSDFAKIDGSTSKHGHDIDGSSEGRINGANKLDLSEDQPLKDDMELLGGFD